MEQKLGRQPAMMIVLLAALAAFFLRRSQLQTGSLLFSWIAGAAIVLFAVYSFLLQPRGEYEAAAERSPVLLAGTVLAALGMAAGSLAMAMALESQADLLLAAAGMISAICVAVVGLDRYRDRRTPPLLFMIPAFYFAVKLICDFRSWSRDPMILDYCYDLLALIAIMCATFHFGGFCFDQGRRRMTVFFCLCGIFFGAAAIANGRMRELAMTGGAMLWLACSLWPLLRRSRKRPEQSKPE